MTVFSTREKWCTSCIQTTAFWQVPAKKKSLREAVVKERKKAKCRDVMIVFAIRRPGCGACRENGRIIAELAEEENVGCLGIIKHINVDNNALLDFYQEYFHHPIYKDEQWKVYHALGNRILTKAHHKV